MRTAATARERTATSCFPALHAVHEHIGWISPGALNYVCQRLTVPPADAYGVATFYALFSLEWRPPRVVHVCDDIACRCHGSDELIAELEERSAPRARSVRTGRRPGSGAPASASATGLRPRCSPWPASIRGARARARRRGRRDRARSPGERSRTIRTRPSPGRRVTACGFCGGSALVDPRSLDDYRAHGGYAALRRALELGPERVIREVKDSKLVGRGGAAFPTGGKWEAVARQPAQAALPDLQRRRVRAGNVQGSRHHRGRPVRADRGDDDRRVRDELRAGLRLPARRVPAGPRDPRARPRRGARARLPRRTTSSARASRSTSRSAREPAPTSAARRRRSSTRSRASAASRATSRRSRSHGLFGEADGHQQRRDARERPRVIVLGGPAFAQSARRGRRARSSSASAVTSRARASTRSRSARRCASCSTWQAAFPAAGASRPCCSAARPGASCGPDELDLPLTFEDARAAVDDPRLGRRHGLRRDGRPASHAHADRRLLP